MPRFFVCCCISRGTARGQQWSYIYTLAAGALLALPMDGAKGELQSSIGMVAQTARPAS